MIKKKSQLGTNLAAILLIITALLVVGFLVSLLFG